MTEKNKGGRPPKYTDVKEVEALIDEYFESEDNYARVIGWELPIYSMAGLALALDMHRETLINYSKKDEFFDTIKRARQKVEYMVEKRTLAGLGMAGGIFNLKNNFGWKDKSEVEKTGTVKNIIVRDNRDKKAVEALDNT